MVVSPCVQLHLCPAPAGVRVPRNVQSDGHHAGRYHYLSSHARKDDATWMQHALFTRLAAIRQADLTKSASEACMSGVFLTCRATRRPKIRCGISAWRSLSSTSAWESLGIACRRQQRSPLQLLLLADIEIQTLWRNGSGFVLRLAAHQAWAWVGFFSIQTTKTVICPAGARAAYRTAACFWQSPLYSAHIRHQEK